MPKFYVESGNLQLVVHAKNARGAAIWAVHRAMSRMLPFLSDNVSKSLDIPGGPIMLGELIRTNERGFGGADSLVHDTFDVVSEWNRLLIALDKLQQEASSEATAV